jgi:hypothetical protein
MIPPEIVGKNDHGLSTDEGTFMPQGELSTFFNLADFSFRQSPIDQKKTFSFRIRKPLGKYG